MKNSLLFFAVIFIFSCGNNAPQTVAPPADLAGFVVVEFPNSNFQKAIRKNPAGNIVEEGELLDGKKTGTWVTYHGDGKNIVNELYNYVDGLKNGLYMKVSNRNQVEQYGYYANDLKDGYWVAYNFSRRKNEENYKEGQLHGMKRIFYNNQKDGIVKEEIEFKNGKQDGIYKYFLEDGTLSLDYDYKDGKQIGGNKVQK